MKKLFMVLSLALPFGLMAQSPTLPVVGQGGPCPHPPCAPGVATHATANGITTVKVKCYNTSIFSCFTVQVGNTPMTPDQIVKGTTGVLKVNDGDGKIVGEQPTVKCESVSKDTDGNLVFLFTKQ